MKKEGFRRLALFLGLLGVGLYVLFCLVAIADLGGLTEITLLEWVLFGTGFVASFLVPWGFVYGIAWVIGGFRNLK